MMLHWKGCGISINGEYRIKYDIILILINYTNFFKPVGVGKVFVKTYLQIDDERHFNRQSKCPCNHREGHVKYPNLKHSIMKQVNYTSRLRKNQKLLTTRMYANKIMRACLVYGQNSHTQESYGVCHLLPHSFTSRCCLKLYFAHRHTRCSESP